MKINFRKNDNIIEMLLDRKVIYAQKDESEQSTIEYIDDPDINLINALFSCQVKDIPYPLHLETWKILPLDDIPLVDFRKNSEGTVIELHHAINLEEWALPFTIHSFLSLFHKKLIEHGYQITESVIEDGTSYTSICAKLQNEQVIQEQLEDISLKISSSSSTILEDLSKKAFGKHILRVFKFPKNYQNICSQYLIWFGEFLENCGINALISVDYNEEETQVIVSSEHTEDMFADIEALFSQYIALPYAECLPAQSQTLSPEQQFMVTQLQTQVNHFKGQLEMKSSAIQLKEATLQSMQNTIQTQQNTIDVQKNQLLLIESMQSDDEVELFGGAIKLGEIEWGPLKICPKKLLDKVRKD
ncbi:hypothetical protein CWO17_15650 [Vibrio sp. 10N.286.45.A3]|uniref:hypothetical protein n=1 Tax=unclassified Vibrio TaxID=2614977 RepID=UPI000D389DD0|nr:MULTISPECIES: hypothetical protein [unclassified Vibrio]PTP01529.1 hypothetical protein CWO17_15650 [Vibrio sp. 10N.286.45.A3]TKE82387.1 hypothetical protein FCV56_12640 [Vibrio sp. F12]TKE98161.1 hypothetical protein FCV61_11780 [Vibrio sp. F12]